MKIITELSRNETCTVAVQFSGRVTVGRTGLWVFSYCFLIFYRITLKSTSIRNMYPRFILRVKNDDGQFFFACSNFSAISSLTKYHVKTAHAIKINHEDLSGEFALCSLFLSRDVFFKKICYSRVIFRLENV